VRRAPASRLAGLLAVLLAASAALPHAIAAEASIGVSLVVSGDPGISGIGPQAVAAGVSSFITALDSGIMEIVPSRAAAAASVTLSPSSGGLAARSELTRNGARASRSSIVPFGSPGSIIPTIAGDLLYLASSLGGFTDTPLSPAPPLAASLSTDELTALTGWNTEEMEPIGLAGTDGGITVLFPHGWLTLGPLFAITRETARDVLAQSFGREPLQLSGIVRQRGDGLALLSEREAKIAWIDPFIGAREVRDAPGLSAGHAERIGAAICSLDGAGFSLWPRDGAPRMRIGIGASWTSAFTTDAEGNLWVFDARELRIRIHTADGREVHSIRPLVRASSLQFPQQIAVFADGSFLLGGAGEVWKFKNTGIPVWRLDRIPGPVAEALPSGLQIAVDRRSGGFALLDGPSRRILWFAGDQAPSDAGSLLALQEAGKAEQRGEGSEARAAASRAVLREKTARLVELAASFKDDLLYDQAERALLRAVESARQLLAEDPADEAAGLMVERLVAQRREVRDALEQEPVVAVSLARAIPRLLPPGRRLAVSLGIRNAGSATLSGLRIRLVAPGHSRMPSLAGIEALAPGREARLEMSLPLLDDAAAPGPGGEIPAAALITFERGAEGGTVPLRFSLRVAARTPAEHQGDLRDALLARVNPEDPLVHSATAELSASAEDPLVATAMVLDALGRLRQPGREAIPGAPAAFSGSRAAIRGPSADPLDWVLLTADIVSGLGLPVGILAWPDAAVVLVDTGISLAEAMAEHAGLTRHKALLQRLSRNGRLCVPLSGDPAPPSSPRAPSVFALTSGLAACSERGVDQRLIAWLEPPGLGTPRTEIAVPFPSRFPVVMERLDRDTLGERIRTALEQKK
jgi:hypothetical protein